MSTIVSIDSQCKAMFGSMVCEAICTLSDGNTWKFNWYQNEVAMYQNDFIGKTPEQVTETWHKRDVMFLRR